MIPSLARASSLGLFFFRKVLGGLLDGCTGSGTGPGRLWYMRMMFPISLLGTLSPPGAGAGLGPLLDPASWAGSASASLAALAPPSVSGFFTTGGGGGDGAGTDQEERKHMRP